jgi:hypothetical protein
MQVSDISWGQAHRKEWRGGEGRGLGMCAFLAFWGSWDFSGSIDETFVIWGSWDLDHEVGRGVRKGGLSLGVDQVGRGDDVMCKWIVCRKDSLEKCLRVSRGSCRIGRWKDNVTVLLEIFPSTFRCFTRGELIIHTLHGIAFRSVSRDWPPRNTPARRVLIPSTTNTNTSTSASFFL